MNSKFHWTVFAALIGCPVQHGFHVAVLNVLLYTGFVEWYRSLPVRAQEYKLYSDHMVMGGTMTSLAIGGICGGILIALFAKAFGRKCSIVVTNVLILIGLTLMVFARLLKAIEMFTCGRVIVGAGVGLGSGLVPMYLVEISPDYLRGAIGSLYYLTVSVAMLFAYIFSSPYMLGSKAIWWVLFLLATIPSVIQIVALSTAPESPKHLYITKAEENEAEEVLASLREYDIEEEIEEIADEAGRLKEIPYTLGRLFKDEGLRSPLVICTVIMIGQQLTGISVIFHYSYFYVSYWERVPKDGPYVLAVGLGVVNVILATAATFLVERVGRKLLLLISFGGMSGAIILMLFMLLLGKRDDVGPAAIDVSFLFLYFYVGFYAIGAGPIPWFLTAELSNHWARPMATTIAVAANWLTCFMVVFFYPLFWEKMGAYLFIIYFVCDVASLIFVFKTLRETKQLQALDIIDMFYE